jgi:outer membrane protein TolC
LNVVLMTAFLSVTAFPSHALYGQQTTAVTSVPGLTIEAAVQLAFKSDPDVKKAELNVEQAQIARDELAQHVDWIPTGGMVLPAYQELFNTFQQAEISLGVAKKVQATQKDLVAKNVIAAYNQVIKDKNNLDLARLSLEQLRKQTAVRETSKDLGMISSFDWQTIERGLKQAEEGVKAAEATYRSSCLALNALMGQSKDKTYELVNRPVVEKIHKNSLDQEYSRATNDAVLVWRAEQMLAIELSKQPWVLPNVSSDLSRILLEQAQVDYEKSKRDARLTIESLYYGIDALERQIQVVKETYNLAQDKLRMAEIKYRVGTLPLLSISPGQEDLMSARVEAEKARAELENLRADLAKLKADFYYVTGRNVYESADWSTGSGSSIDLQTVNYKPQTGKRISFTVGAPTYMNGDDIIALDTPAYIKSGRTYLPVRALGESLGAVVSWDEDTRTVTLTRGEDRVEMKIGDYNIKVNGSYTTMEVVPEITGGRTMLPARYVAEAFGALISWDERNQEVVIFR